MNNNDKIIKHYEFLIEELQENENDYLRDYWNHQLALAKEFNKEQQNKKNVIVRKKRKVLYY